MSFVHDAVVVNQHSCCRGIELVQAVREVGGVGLLAQGRRCAYICEHDTDVNFYAAGREMIKTELTHVRVLARRLMPEHADEPATQATKGVVAQLVAGIARKPTKDSLRDS